MLTGDKHGVLAIRRLFTWNAFVEDRLHNCCRCPWTYRSDNLRCVSDERACLGEGNVSALEVDEATTDDEGCRNDERQGAAVDRDIDHSEMAFVRPNVGGEARATTWPREAQDTPERFAGPCR